MTRISLQYFSKEIGTARSKGAKQRLCFFTVILIGTVVLCLCFATLVNGVTGITPDKGDVNETNPNESRKNQESFPELKEGLVWEDESYHLRLWGNLRNLIIINKIDDGSLLNPDDVFDIERSRNDTEARLKFDGNFIDRIGMFVRWRLRNEYVKSREDTSSHYEDNIDQLFATLELGNEIITFISIGKQRVKWGTGFFWNPVDTFNPRQDLKDRQRIEEGKISYRADLAFPSLSLTGVLVPDVESKTLSLDNFKPEEDRALLTGRFYTFLWDTDLSFYVSYRDNEDVRWGTSFSTVVSDIQFFGEAIYWRGESNRNYVFLDSDRREVFDPIGNTHFTVPKSFDIRKKEGSFYQVVLGFQYTFWNDLTVIGEYYHNRDGYDDNEMGTYLDFLRYVGDGYQSDVDSVIEAKNRNPLLQIPSFASREELLAVGNGLYEFAGTRRNYIRLSGFWPFVANRFELGMDFISALDDGSLFLRSAIAYTAIPDWRFALYSQWYLGGKDTEFGIYPYDYSLFSEVRYFF